MMDVSQDLIDLCSIYGLVLAGALTLVYLFSLKFNPEAWTAEFTNGKKKGDGRGQLYVSIIMALTTLLVFYYADKEILNTFIDAGQPALFLANGIIFIVYNLTDLLLVDYLLQLRIRLEFMDVPGQENQYKMRTHLTIFMRNFVYGGVLAFVASILATAMF